LLVVGRWSSAMTSKDPAQLTVDVLCSRGEAAAGCTRIHSQT
jgi:hypothetical protein